MCSVYTWSNNISTYVHRTFLVLFRLNCALNLVPTTILTVAFAMFATSWRFLILLFSLRFSPLFFFLFHFCHFSLPLQCRNNAFTSDRLCNVALCHVHVHVLTANTSTIYIYELLSLSFRWCVFYVHFLLSFETRVRAQRTRFDVGIWVWLCLSVCAGCCCHWGADKFSNTATFI